MSAPGGSQQTLRTVTQWRYCRGCQRAAPLRRLAGDVLWQCLHCGNKQQDEVSVTASNIPEQKVGR